MTSSSYRKPIIIIVIIGLIYATSLALRSGLADVFAQQGLRQLTLWYQSPTLPTDSQWQLAHSHLNKALYFQPDHPTYLETLGQIFEWQALMVESLSTENAAIARRKAIHYYQLAIKKRPVWPFSWAYLALSKQRLNEIDDEFNQAIQQAAILGTPQIRVQLLLAEAGLAAWHQIDFATQQTVIDLIERGLNHQPQQIVTIAKNLQRLALMCANIKRTQVTQEYCNDSAFL